MEGSFHLVRWVKKVFCGRTLNIVFACCGPANLSAGIFMCFGSMKKRYLSFLLCKNGVDLIEEWIHNAVLFCNFIILDLCSNWPYEIMVDRWPWAQSRPREHRHTGFLHVPPQSPSQSAREQPWPWRTPAGLPMPVWGPSFTCCCVGRAAFINCCIESSSSSLFSTTSSVLFIGTPVTSFLNVFVKGHLDLVNWRLHSTVGIVQLSLQKKNDVAETSFQTFLFAI